MESKVLHNWSTVDAFREKTLIVIVMTVLLTIGFNSMLNNLLTREVTAEGGIYTYTNHFSLGIFGVILALPALLVSTLIVRFILTKLKRQPTFIEKGILFKWYSIYGIVIGFLVFGMLTSIAQSIGRGIDSTSILGTLIFIFISMVIPILTGVVTCKLVNIYMVRLTKTNHEIISEVINGEYDDQFKNHIEKRGALKVLKSGGAFTISRAIQIQRVSYFFAKWRRILTRTFFLVLLQPILPRKLFNKLSGVSNTQVKTTRDSNSQYYNDQEEIKRKERAEKEEADYQYEKASKNAAYQVKYLEKQLNFNPKHARSNINRVNNALKTKNQAKKHRDSL